MEDDCKCSLCLRQGMRPGLQVRRARLEAGLTQAQLARYADVTPAQVCHLENGGSPSFKVLTKIASAAGIAVVVGKETEWGRDLRPGTGRKMETLLVHGTTTSYTRGCRCDPCKYAGTEQKRKWRESQECST